MKRPLRLLMLMVGLVPAIVLGLVAAYGMVGSNTWSVTSTVALDVQAEDVTLISPSSRMDVVDPTVDVEDSETKGADSEQIILAEEN